MHVREIDPAEAAVLRLGNVTVRGPDGGPQRRRRGGPRTRAVVRAAHFSPPVERCCDRRTESRRQGTRLDGGDVVLRLRRDGR